MKTDKVDTETSHCHGRIIELQEREQQTINNIIPHSGSKRRNLIVVRAGDKSLHPGWIKNGDLGNFDIFVSYFGETPGRFQNGCNFYESVAGLKWPVLAKLFSQRPELFTAYDAYWFPDDDLEADTKVISRMFDLFNENALWLAQPALGPGSYVSYPATAQVIGSKLRHVGFVEIMCPIFSRKALEILAPTFSSSASGWGLDFLWSHLLSDRQDRIAMLDETPVVHTRPIGTGSFYSFCNRMGISPKKDLSDILTQYGIQWRLNIPVYKHVPCLPQKIEAANAAVKSKTILGSTDSVVSQMAHLLDFAEEEAMGPIQREEALFLFGIIRVIRPKIVVEFGYGRSTLNFLYALNDLGDLYSFDISDAATAHAVNNFAGFKNFHFIKKSQDKFSPADVGGQTIDFVFMDCAHNLDLSKKTFAALMPSLSPDAIVAIHDTGTWRREHFLPKHVRFQRNKPSSWLNSDEFQHQKSEREFANWIADNYPDFHLLHFHSPNCIRHGITLLQRHKILIIKNSGINSNENRGRQQKMHLAGVAEAVCINLQRRQERWSAFQCRAKKVGLECVRRFNAIDGKSLEMPDELQSHRGAYGCLHSHAAVYNEALKNSASHILVFEDDCVFAPQIETIAEYLKATIGSYSWIHLGGTNHCYPKIESYYSTHIQVSNIFNTHAYVIDRTLMLLYVKWLEKNPFPRDGLLHADRLLRHLCKHNSLNICIPPQPLAWQDKSQPTDVQWGVPKRV